MDWTNVRVPGFWATEGLQFFGFGGGGTIQAIAVKTKTLNC